MKKEASFAKKNKLKNKKERLYPEYPLFLWLLGLLLLLKALFWLFANPLIVEPLIGIKHAVFTLPFLILWKKVWDQKEWAVYAALVLAALDLIFFLIFYPKAVFIAFDVPLIKTELAYGLNKAFFYLLNLLILLCSAMIGYAINIFILFTAFFALKQRGKNV